MVATGIVRRIDELGRIVIPKELRRSMNIKEGDPLEMFLDKSTNTISLRHYITNEGRETSTILDDLEHGAIEGMPTEEIEALKALLRHYYKVRGEG